MHFIYHMNLSYAEANNHESRFNLFGLINQQCITYVAGPERMTTGSVAKRLNL